MEEKQPSRTALGAAVHRAAHQTLEGGRIFSDPFASRILGSEGAKLLAEEAADPSRRPMRMFIAARSRFAEDRLAAAVSGGIRQAVILGAGLDTFALRNPHAGLGLRIVEVDHPSTQEWKKKRLSEAGIDIPSWLTFLPLDFEHQDPITELAAAGFTPSEPAFFHWLGVIPYLKREAIFATLQQIASLPEAQVVFDYSEPLENYPPERRARLAAIAARTAEIGEPWLTYFEAPSLKQDLTRCGFGGIEDLNIAQVASLYFGLPPGEIKEGAGPHLVHARRSE
jgi:methyltransferase (TIGR00027 family)